MKVGVFLAALAILSLLALWSVEKRLEEVRIGYELGELRERARRIERGNRLLREEAARLSTPAVLVSKGRQMRLELVEPALAGQGPEGAR